MVPKDYLEEEEVDILGPTCSRLILYSNKFIVNIIVIVIIS